MFDLSIGGYIWCERRITTKLAYESNMQSGPASTGKFPKTRLRRTRMADWSRRLHAESKLCVDAFIQPIFVCEGREIREPVAQMPGVERLSIDQVVKEVCALAGFGVPAVALFPATPESLKSADGSEALNPSNLACRAIEEIRRANLGIGIICDVALDPYTDHGHDGLLADGVVVNDETVDILAKQALVLADAGADIVAPSDMMDGRVGAIRTALETSGHSSVQIMAYAAKYASCFYGPFRGAVGSGNLLSGDKKTYQLAPANRQEALREVALDIQEGADSIIVKPGLAYLDIIRDVTDTHNIPTFGYQVSGEYSMLHAAASAGCFELDAGILETLTAYKRAGATGILTYFTKYVLEKGLVR